MRFISVVLLLWISIISGCNSGKIVEWQAGGNSQHKLSQPNRIDEDSAIEIAKKEFIKESGPISSEEYAVGVYDDGKNWEVKFTYIHANGDPAHYYIDKTTGEIVKRSIYQ